MKLTNIFNNLLLEDFKNKKLLNSMNQKWFGGEENRIASTDNYLTKFFEIKDKLTPNRPEIKSFMLNFPKFDIKRLNDVTVYSLKEIIKLLGYFHELNERKDTGYPEIFDGFTEKTNEDLINASKQLWFEKRNNLIFEDDGFRIYRMNGKKDAMIYGFYSQYINETLEGPKNTRWCVTWRSDSNMWATYRNNRSYYFVIDESKTPNSNDYKYYLSVLQPLKTGGFILTSVANDGDINTSVETLKAIYPKIGPALEKVKYINYNPKVELQLDDKKINELDLMNEDENNEYCFAKVNNNLKKLYLERGRYITKQISWETMSKELKVAYIDMTVKENARERFSTKELLMAIQSNKGELKSLDRRLKMIGFPIGFGDLYNEMMMTQYFPDERRSVSKPYISLFKNRLTKKLGIFDKHKGTWLEKDGVKYEDEYEEIDIDDYEDDEGNDYVVYIYSKTGSEDQDSFVVVSNFDDLINGHFISNRNWKQLKEKLRLRNEEDDEDVDLNIDNDTDVDLHEIK